MSTHNSPSSSGMGGGRRGMKHLYFRMMIVVFIVISGSIILYVINHKNTVISGNYHHSKPVKTDITIKGFQPPNTTEAQINEVYDTGLITLQVMDGTSTYTNNTLTSAGYHIRYTSESLQPVTINNAALNVGCIASGNRSYKDDQNIFNAGKGSTTFSVLRSQNATLAAYTSAEVDIIIPNNCQYLGTANGKYWWPMQDPSL